MSAAKPAPAKSAYTDPNTGTFAYLDTKTKKTFCEDEKKAIAKHCGPEDHSTKQERQKKARGGAASLLAKLKLPAKKTPTGKAKNNWLNEHCEFLMVKPGSADELYAEIEKLPATLAESLGKKVLEETIEKAKKKLEREIEEKVAKILLKKGAQKVAGRALSLLTGPFAIVINVAMTAYDIYDAQNTYNEVAEEFKSKFAEIKSTMDKLADVNRQIDEVRNQINHADYKNKNGTFSKQKLISDVMHAAAEMNECIRARRCNLVQYSKTDSTTGNGCCPGQTGHHVLPSTMFEGCTKYNKDTAPTICVEGASNWAGSHKKVHDKMRKRLERLTTPLNVAIPLGSEITLKQAIDSGASSVTDAFPMAGCSEKCLKAQLGPYYEKLKCKPKSNSGASGGDESTGQTVTPAQDGQVGTNGTRR